MGGDISFCCLDDFDCYGYSSVCQPAFTSRLCIELAFSDVELMLIYSTQFIMCNLWPERYTVIGIL